VNLANGHVISEIAHQLGIPPVDMLTTGNITVWNVDRVTEKISSLLCQEGELGELLKDLNTQLSTALSHIKTLNEALQWA
jgi:hypothetical protein